MSLQYYTGTDDYNLNVQQLLVGLYKDNSRRRNLNGAGATRGCNMK